MKNCEGPEPPSRQEKPASSVCAPLWVRLTTEGTSGSTRGSLRQLKSMSPQPAKRLEEVYPATPECSFSGAIEKPDTARHGNVSNAATPLNSISKRTSQSVPDRRGKISVNDSAIFLTLSKPCVLPCASHRGTSRAEHRWGR